MSNPGFEVGFSVERERLDDGGFAAVFGLELFGELADSLLDAGTALRPQVQKFGGHPDDFSYRSFAGFGCAGRELHAQLQLAVLFEGALALTTSLNDTAALIHARSAAEVLIDSAVHPTTAGAYPAGDR